MDSRGIFEALQAKFGDDVVFGYEPPKLATLDDHFFVRSDGIVEVCRHLRDESAFDFNFLECLSGVDYPKDPVKSSAAEHEEEPIGSIHVVYHLRSYARKHRVVLKVSLPRSEPSVDTVCDIWSAAHWQERECYDLLGVHFKGHPDLRRVMLPDDWQGHPLRKDYEEQPTYQGIPTTRANPLDLLTLKKSDETKEAPKPTKGKEPAKAKVE